MVRRQRSFRVIVAIFILLLSGFMAELHGQTTLVATGDSWRYLDTGVEPPANWQQPDFDDSSWPAGPSPLGFGPGESVVTSLTPGITTAYFRHEFQMGDMLPSVPLKLRVLRDDGVIVYLNGLEVFRENMPPGTPNYDTLALAITEADSYLEGWIDDPFFFVAGKNVLAVEVHQVTPSSSDIVFDLQLQDTNSTMPRVMITSPLNNSLVPPGDLTITALAEPSAEVLTVDFYLDDIYLDSDLDTPYQVVWPVAPGTYVLTAVAWFVDLTVLTSEPVLINVSDGTEPSVSITSPTPNSTIGPGSITIEAFASDVDGSVTNVEFFVNAQKIGEDPVFPFSTVWSNASLGDFTITARATDNDGFAASSAPIVVHVSSAEGRVIRGPYLQTGTPTSVIVKWRTDIASDSVVRYGLTEGNLNQTAQVSTITTEHQVPLSGLSPDTRYYYSIGTSTVTQGAGPDFFFVTSPSTPKPTRIWVIGDSGTGTEDARRVWLSYSNYTRGRYTDLWLMLGDNAYGTGTDGQYQSGMFDMYPDILRQTVVWPTIGNHDFDPAYFNIFSLPRNGEAGGVPSGVENYYSFDYGAIHFVCLAGYYSGSRLSNGVMCTWLKADLEANTNKWLIAFWHQPPYTKGSHDSEWEQDLIEMRENAVPILESYGVDLVLCGHSHVYERSYLLHGHYGYTNSFQAWMKLDPGSGRTDDTGAYLKQTSGPNAHQGTVYVVAGSSGWATFGSLDHPAMYKSLLQMGSLALDIDGDTLNGSFIRETGDIDDYFTLVKESTVVRIVSVNVEEGATTVTWTSTPGRHYQLEFSPDLAAGWATVGDAIQANSSLTGTGHATGDAPRGFYRVVQID